MTQLLQILGIYCGRNRIVVLLIMNRTKNKETSGNHVSKSVGLRLKYMSNLYFVVPASCCKVKDDIVTFCIAQSVTE